MHSFDFGSEELRMLWASAALGLIQLVLMVLCSVSARPFRWAIGARDEAGASMGRFGERIERAWKNFLETFPIFAAAVLLGAATSRHSPATALGADLYFWGRVIYVPLYAIGIPLLRTLAWAVALAGIVTVLLGIWPGI